MIALLIIGVIFLVIGFPLMRMLEKRNSRWSNLVLAICIMLGILCIGIFGLL